MKKRFALLLALLMIAALTLPCFAGRAAEEPEAVYLTVVQALLSRGSVQQLAAFKVQREEGLGSWTVNLMLDPAGRLYCTDLEGAPYEEQNEDHAFVRVKELSLSKDTAYLTFCYREGTVSPGLEIFYGSDNTAASSCSVFGDIYSLTLTEKLDSCFTDEPILPASASAALTVATEAGAAAPMKESELVEETASAAAEETTAAAENAGKPTNVLAFIALSLSCLAVVLCVGLFFLTKAQQNQTRVQLRSVNDEVDRQKKDLDELRQSLNAELERLKTSHSDGWEEVSSRGAVEPPLQPPPSPEPPSAPESEEARCFRIVNDYYQGKRADLGYSYQYVEWGNQFSVAATLPEFVVQQTETWLIVIDGKYLSLEPSQRGAKFAYTSILKNYIHPEDFFDYVTPPENTPIRRLIPASLEKIGEGKYRLLKKGEIQF